MGCKGVYITRTCYPDVSFNFLFCFYIVAMCNIVHDILTDNHNIRFYGELAGLLAKHLYHLVEREMIIKSIETFT